MDKCSCYCYCSVVSDSLRRHGLQNARIPWHLPSPTVCSTSGILSRWCHATISSCRPLLLLPSIYPSIRVFSNESVFASGGPSIGASALASVLPMNIQSSFPLELTGFISLLSKGLSKVFSNTTVQKHQFFSALPSLCSNSHNHTRPLEKP